MRVIVRMRGAVRVIVAGVIGTGVILAGVIVAGAMRVPVVGIVGMVAMRCRHAGASFAKRLARMGRRVERRISL